MIIMEMKNMIYSLFCLFFLVFLQQKKNTGITFKKRKSLPGVTPLEQFGRRHSKIRNYLHSHIILLRCRRYLLIRRSTPHSSFYIMVSEMRKENTINCIRIYYSYLKSVILQDTDCALFTSLNILYMYMSY